MLSIIILIESIKWKSDKFFLRFSPAALFFLKVTKQKNLWGMDGHGGFQALTCHHAPAPPPREQNEIKMK